MLSTRRFSLEEACQSTSYFVNLREIIQTHSNEAARNLGLSIISSFSDDHEKSLEYLELLVQKNPDVALLHQRIAEFCIDFEQYEKAIFHLEKVIELQKQDLTARFWLCLIYHLLEEPQKAQNLFEYLKKSVYWIRVKTGNWREE